jgi:hypothetical protein
VRSWWVKNQGYQAFLKHNSGYCLPSGIRSIFCRSCLWSWPWFRLSLWSRHSICPRLFLCRSWLAING